jgi:hypothetical protein
VITPAPEQFRLPPNATRAKREKHDTQMREWLCDQLNEQNTELVSRAGDVTLEELQFDGAFYAADNGDVGPLRALCAAHANPLIASLADYLQPPKLRRGVRRRQQRRQIDPVLRQAADFARRIRALWVAQYGTKRRWQGEMTAEDFAVDILQEVWSTRIDADAVRALLKPSGKRKPHRIADVAR